MKKETIATITTGVVVGGTFMYNQVKKFKFKKDRMNKEGNYNAFLNICEELGVDFNSGEQLSDETMEKICKLYKQRTGKDLMKDFKYAFK